MAKPRATTIQQKFGFRDEDLKKPDHDTMMLWLHANAEHVTNAVFWKDWTEDDLNFPDPWGYEYSKITYHVPPRIASIEKRPLSVKRKVWEYAIMSGRYCIGFVDMAVWYGEEHISVNRETSEFTRNEMSTSSPQVHFEIKTTIPSLGELIRQIRMYQQYTRAQFVVISPDDHFADALESQGIHFYKYTGDPLDVAMT